MAEAKNIKLYEGSEDWAALYVEGKLVEIGDRYVVQETLLDLLGVESFSSDDFLRGGDSREDAAQTLEEIDTYRNLRAQVELDAHLLDVQARKFEARAKELRDSLKPTS